MCTADEMSGEFIEEAGVDCGPLRPQAHGSPTGTLASAPQIHSSVIHFPPHEFTCEFKQTTRRTLTSTPHRQYVSRELQFWIHRVVRLTHVQRLIPKADRKKIHEYLFREGVLVAKKDFNLPKHGSIDTKNLYVCLSS